MASGYEYFVDGDVFVLDYWFIPCVCCECSCVDLGFGGACYESCVCCGFVVLSFADGCLGFDFDAYVYDVGEVFFDLSCYFSAYGCVIHYCAFLISCIVWSISITDFSASFSVFALVNMSAKNTPLIVCIFLSCVCFFRWLW